MAIDQHSVGQRPQALGRLQLGRVGRQKQQMDVLGDAQVEAGVPTRAVENQHNLFTRPSAHLAHEGGEFDVEERDADRRGEMEDGAPGGGMDKTDEIAPLIAMLDRRDGARLSKRQTLRRMGFSPMRCSSVAQSSTCAWGKAVATARRSGRSFFERVLGSRVGLHVARAGLAALAVEPHEVGPAQVDTDWSV